ncbi:hypothetical protein [Pedobacter nyackensis]|uniref:hypothetical protein n=1 Tax=Pedobacter nyackensis TaxID=475255 RepID=UPI002931D0A8|nr:hypothetical protein [Pedobacter nyackensis]
MKSKAVFLLVTFLLNTIVGFACALAMVVNDDENHSVAESAYHVHHDHQNSNHKHNKTNIFDQNPSNEDHCCQSLSTSFVTQSKLVPEIGKVSVVLPVLWLLESSYAFLFYETSVKSAQGVCIDHRDRPPNQDIRIIIKSFQI